MQRLGCLSPLGLLAATLALVGTLVVGVVSGGAMFSPGALSAMTDTHAALGGVTSHAEIGGNCAACHAEPWSEQVMASRCLICHTDVQAELRNPKTLHGALSDSSTCRHCHTEHNGAEAALTRLDANFPHELVGFALTRHQKQSSGIAFSCQDCHVAGLTQFTQTECATCHKNAKASFAAHIADFGSNCLACHDGVDRFSKFDHKTVAFPLLGKHVGAKCNQCHVNAVTLADLKKVSQKCVDCHRKDDKHKGAYGAECAACHAAEDWKKVTFDHNLSAFKLIGKHTPVDCVKCHVNNVFKGTPQKCVDCHRKDDKHKGAYGTDCAQCHTAEDWKKATFDHNLSTFRLTGKHTAVDCVKCHVNNVFKGTPQTCVACHPDPVIHKGAFGTDCAQCHTTTTWKGATFKHTFPLNHGARANSACTVCHTPPNYKAYTCYGCHEHDPAEIAREHQKEGIAKFDDCARCHPTGREKEGGKGD